MPNIASTNWWADLRWTRILVATAVMGLLVGFAGRATDHTDSELISWLGVIGAPWLIAAFLTGAAIGERWSAAVAGALSQALAVAVYYALMYKVEYRATAQYALVMTIGWSFFAAMLGAGMAYIGALARSRSARARAASLAVFSGLLIGEAIFGFMVWSDPQARLIVGGELLVGMAALMLFAPRGQVQRAMALAAAVAIVALVVEAGVTELMIEAGWGGARRG